MNEELLNYSLQQKRKVKKKNLQKEGKKNLQKMVILYCKKFKRLQKKSYLVCKADKIFAKEFSNSSLLVPPLSLWDTAV